MKKAGRKLCYYGRFEWEIKGIRGQRFKEPGEEIKGIRERR